MITKTTQPLSITELLNAYKNSNKRLFLFDYDGTLTPIVQHPEDATPSSTLLNHLGELCKDPLNSVWIISGRDQLFLNTYLGKIPSLGLSAEHGSFMKMPGFDDWVDMLKDVDLPWKQNAMEIFEKYTVNNPGTVIEQKKSSITWHYRNAINLAETINQTKSCYQELKDIPGIDILENKMNIEVRSILVNKGHVVNLIKQQLNSDFIICAGDDHTDEDMFNALQDDQNAFCVYVGSMNKVTTAKYCVDDPKDVLNTIGQLIL